jgi:hypothetical protein
MMRNGILLKTRFIACTWLTVPLFIKQCRSLGSGFLLKRGRKLLLIYPSTTDFYLSERKWKEKLKEWKFDKKISTTDMRIVVAKAEKRARNEGKDTTFFHGDMQITAERIEQFKRRKTVKDVERMSPGAGQSICFGRIR